MKRLCTPVNLEFCVSCKVLIEEGEKKEKNENVKSSLKLFIKVELN